MRQPNIQLWRISTQTYASTAFTGEGSALVDGRWNSKGTRLVYTSDSLALALLEMTVHITDKSIHAKYVYFGVTVPIDITIDTIGRSELPQDWSESSSSQYLKDLGDEWIRTGKTAIFCVPSVIIPVGNNYLINPSHPDFQKLIISPEEKFVIDPRIKG